ncbi:hypothetical protein PybrP1_011239 [[Pythium] brassicae (nom. inval.)]|nr:hypothetical protein PybrP1_011239 [[Pythium] brassicae (nom. inval.)]
MRLHTDAVPLYSLSISLSIYEAAAKAFLDTHWGGVVRLNLDLDHEAVPLAADALVVRLLVPDLRLVVLGHLGAALEPAAPDRVPARVRRVPPKEHLADLLVVRGMHRVLDVAATPRRRAVALAVHHGSSLVCVDARWRVALPPPGEALLLDVRQLVARRVGDRHDGWNAVAAFHPVRDGRQVREGVLAVGRSRVVDPLVLRRGGPAHALRA